MKEDVKVIFPRKKPFNRAIKPHKIQLIKKIKRAKVFLAENGRSW